MKILNPFRHQHQLAHKFGHFGNQFGQVDQDHLQICKSRRDKREFCNQLFLHKILIVKQFSNNLQWIEFLPLRL
jgi:hypothetical protein